MTYRAASCNAHAPSSAAKNRATINTAAARTDVLLVQEADSQVVAAMRALKGFTVFVPKGLGARNPIAWRTDMFELVTSGWSRIMRNRPGIKDGPDRSMVWVVLREKATGRLVVHINAHLIHQAFTSHRERRPSWFASLAVLGAKGAILFLRHRCPVIFNADWNNPHKFNIPGVDEREVASPATFGSRRYDRFFIVGKATASQVQAIVTPSDHRTLVATIVLGPTLPSVPPTPTPPKEEHMLPSNLPERLRAAGFKVTEHPGWRTRKRPGRFSPVGVLCHHTATGPKTSDEAVTNLLIRGRADLPGPLCQIGLARDGTVHLIAAGRANHAGKAKASGTVAAGDGNQLYIGIEAFNDGVGEKWPAIQYDTYARLAAFLCREVTGNSVATVRGHKETSVTGKVDPTFDMDEFRRRVAPGVTDQRPPAKEEPRLNNVQKGRAELAEGFAHFRAGITHLRRAKGRPAVAIATATIRAAYGAAAAAFNRMPKS